MPPRPVQQPRPARAFARWSASDRQRLESARAFCEQPAYEARPCQPAVHHIGNNRSTDADLAWLDPSCLGLLRCPTVVTSRAVRTILDLQTGNTLHVLPVRSGQNIPIRQGVRGYGGVEVLNPLALPLKSGFDPSECLTDFVRPSQTPDLTF